MKRVPNRRTILLLAIFLAGCAGAPTRPESVGRGDYAKVAEYVSALVRHEMKKRNVTGLSIARAASGEGAPPPMIECGFTTCPMTLCFGSYTSSAPCRR